MSIANTRTVKPQSSLIPETSLNGVSQKKALQLHRTMLRIRRAQEALIEEYHPADEMRCPVHFCVGQEAIPAGVCLDLRKDDYTFTGHRSHGYYLAKGGSLQGLFAELYGKATGSNRGKAGSQEICDEEVNFFSGTILVGTLPIGAGAALASKMRGEDRVTVVVFGDGGADEGIVYETLNFAAVKQLPMIFICENNSYSIHTRQSTRQTPCDLAGRAEAFGVPARRLYGNDVGTVYKAASRAIKKARAGGGPSFLEIETYRLCGHVGPEGDDHLGYRPMEELNMWKDRCPIQAAEIALAERGFFDGAISESLDGDLKKELDEAFDFAKSSPFPRSEDMLKDVFAENPWSEPVDLPSLLDSPFDFDQPEAVPKPY